jgi:uncharacterized SAM-binding protein YcdF (DUF218 family)
MVNSGTFSFVIWLFGAAFFALCFFLAGKKRWDRLPKLAKGIFVSLVAICSVVFLTCQICILSHFFDKGEKDLDYVIVLGAQMRSSGPSVIYKYRLKKAAQYLEANEGTICVVTGGQGANEPISEGEGGKEYLLSLGIPEERIIAETTSLDTSANISNALELINSDKESELSIGIITNGFHVFRGVHIARKLTDAHVCGIAAYMQFRFIPNNMVRETFGILRDLLYGRI